jgi:hypothetical protein
MEITTGEYFWTRWGWTGRLVAAWGGGTVVLAGLVGGLAGAAQHAARVDARAQGLGGGPYTYSLSQHVAAMVLLGVLAVAVAAILDRRGTRVLAALALLGAAAGPMTLVAAPAWAGVVRTSLMDTQAWWHAAVAVSVLAVLGSWTLWVERALPAPSAVRSAAGPGPSRGAVFTILAAVLFVVFWNKSWELQESPGVVPALGWALLVAALGVAASRAALRVRVALLVLSAAVPALLYLAYQREGGWPGVAGWELGGMQSPVITSTSIVVCLLAAVPVGAAFCLLARPLRSRVPLRAGS